MTNKIKALLATALVAGSISAHAGVITVGGLGVTDATHTENFEGGTVGRNISGSFGTKGLTFTTVGTAGISLTNTGVCNNMSGGMSGKYLAMGLNYPCGGDATNLNSVSIMFGADLSELSWMGFNRTFGDGFTIQALLDGTVVSQTSFAFANGFDKKIVHFAGSRFDEIRLTEATVWQGFFGIDNMAWKLAPAVVTPPSDVPEPSIALLFGIGMMGLGFMSKKQKN